MINTTQMCNVKKFYCEVVVGEYIADNGGRNRLEVYDYLINAYYKGNSHIPSDISIVSCYEGLPLYEAILAINEMIDLMVDSAYSLFQKMEKDISDFDFPSIALKHYAETSLEEF